MTEHRDVDLVVLGSGAAGLTAAVVAARHGLDVLVIEKSRYIGGTTAISGGMVWVPNNHLMQAAGIHDSLEDATTYLEHTAPNQEARAGLCSYLEQAPKAIQYLCDETDVKLQPVARYPDYYPEQPGATLGGRVLEPVPFDGGRLADAFSWLRPPLAAFTILGGMMIARRDIVHFRRFGLSATSTLRVLRLVARHARERVQHSRGTSLVLGNALAGRLLLSALKAGVSFHREISVSRLLFDNDRCTGVQIGDGAADVASVRARRGVVLATGGFSHDRDLRQHLMAEVADEISAAVDTVTGDGIRFARTHSASLANSPGGPAFWAPVSTYTTSSGKRVVYPHTVTDRAKPGFIAVDKHGARFVNECVSYHEFVRAMLASSNYSAMRAYLICDQPAIWRYGLGAIKPFSRHLSPFIDAGYLKRANTIEDLAAQLDLDPQTLHHTLLRFNEGAQSGNDPEFGRGSNAYQRHLGDSDRTPNPCVAPLETPPYYAVELRPGDLGTSSGLRTDETGHVQTQSGATLAGLYAAGNDRASVMAGHYPGPGITLGPALTHGYLIGRAAAQNR